MNYVELNRPDLMPHLSTTKSPQQMHGAISKRILAPLLASRDSSADSSPDTSAVDTADTEPPRSAYVVSVMPCTAKKEEALRPTGAGDIDAVVTTRELARMIRARGIDFASLENSWAPFDSPLGESTGAGQIFGASGGVMEAAARTALHILREKDPEPFGDAAPTIDFHPVRGVGRGIKEAELPVIGRVAVCNGIAAGMELLAQPGWKERYTAIEVMACVGGCLGGGGEPQSMDPNILQKRAQAIYAIDAKTEIRRSDLNEEVRTLYKEHLGGQPGSHEAHQLLHTDYAERRTPRCALGRVLAAVDLRDGAKVASLFAEDSAEWDTATETYGVVRGRPAIEALVNERLPPPPAPNSGLRHRLADPATGMAVKMPNGELCEFNVELDPGTGLVQRLTRIPEVSKSQ